MKDFIKNQERNVEINNAALEIVNVIGRRQMLADDGIWSLSLAMRVMILAVREKIGDIKDAEHAPNDGIPEFVMEIIERTWRLPMSKP